MSAASLHKMQEVGQAWHDARRALDNKKIVSLLSDDATVWYNSDPKITHDRTSYCALLDSSAKRFRNQRYKDVRLHVHAGGFVEQATLEADTDKGVIEIPFLLVATVNNEKIERLEEYFDNTIICQAGLTEG